MTEAFEIRQAGVADVPSLRELWLGMHEHHRAVMPELAPYVSDEESWRVRAAIYREILGRPTGVLLIAHDGGEQIGYALGVVLSREEKAWLDDTWVNTGLVGEVESLAVRPGHRGQGVGSKLLRRLEDELTALGSRDLVLGVLPGNRAAIELYQRFGYRPTWLYLSKLSGRELP